MHHISCDDFSPIMTVFCWFTKPLHEINAYVVVSIQIFDPDYIGLFERYVCWGQNVIVQPPLFMNVSWRTRLANNEGSSFSLKIQLLGSPCIPNMIVLWIQELTFSGNTIWRERTERVTKKRTQKHISASFEQQWLEWLRGNEDFASNEHWTT